MRRRVITQVWPVVLVAAALSYAVGAASAAEQGAGAASTTNDAKADVQALDDEKLPDVPALESGSDRAKNKKAPKRDLVALAFALPHDTVLNDKQTKAMAALKKRLEPGLRSAVEKMEKLPEGAEKTAAAHEVRKLTKEIHTEVDNILDMPAADAAKKQAAPAKPYNGARRRPVYPYGYY